MRKHIIGLLAGFLGFFAAQASLVRYPATKDMQLQAFAVNGKDIWGVALKNVTAPAPGQAIVQPGSFIVKWDEASQLWKEVAPIAPEVGRVISVAISPKGEFFVLMGARFTKEMAAVFQQLLAEVDRVFKESMKPFLDGWVSAGKIDRAAADRFLTSYDMTVRDKVGQQEFIKAIESAQVAGKKATDDFLRLKGVTQRITQPLFKYANGKLEQVHDFTDQSIKDIAFDGAGTMFALSGANDCSSGKCFMATSVLQQVIQPNKKTTWELLGAAIPGVWNFSVSKDGSIFVGGTQLMGLPGVGAQPLSPETKFFSWNKSQKKWGPISIQLPDKAMMGYFVAVDAKNVWFNIMGQANRAQLFQWNGQSLKKKFDQEAYWGSPVPGDKRIWGGIGHMVFDQGKIYFTDFAGNLFIYTPLPAPAAIKKQPTPVIRMAEK